MRDTSAIFVLKPDQTLGGVNFNFNGWGNKQKHANDKKVADAVSTLAGAVRLQSSIVLEGGGIEVDGEGTAIATESCIINSNRNPGVTKADVEAELLRLLGVTKVIWLPGVAGADITDGHIDFYARFAGPGVVVVGIENDPQYADYAITREQRATLQNATDAAGRTLQVYSLDSPGSIRPTGADAKDFAAGYLGFYVLNDAVLVQNFGDTTTDNAAVQTLRTVFPGRTVKSLNTDAISIGGGSIHCATQQQPVSSAACCADLPSEYGIISGSPGSISGARTLRVALGIVVGALLYSGAWLL
mmetsp:Transcript_68453/g.160916  ORF Transcript_68453/g.160916 Transcript_68453/m.160916 type:complete len:301 (+) Transcript_68453:3-905(+)